MYSFVIVASLLCLLLLFVDIHVATILAPRGRDSRLFGLQHTCVLTLCALQSFLLLDSLLGFILVCVVLKRTKTALLSVVAVTMAVANIQIFGYVFTPCQSIVYRRSCRLHTLDDHTGPSAE